MREKILFVVAVVAFVTVVPLVYYLLFEHGLSVSSSGENRPMPPRGLEVEKVAPEKPLPTVLPSTLSVTETRGKVEIGREGGRWQPAEVGMVLGAMDRIRTDPLAYAVLSMPGFFSIELDSGSEFEVKSLAENASRFLLGEGMLSADVVDDPERSFEVEAAESVARTSGGSFKMSLNKEGFVALGTSRGAVEVEAAGKVIEVREGYVTRINRGQPPRDPIEVPTNLFLRVRWPRKQEMSRRRLVVAGRTLSGTRVRIEGATIVVDSKGRFRHAVALKEGANKLKVEAYDVAGNKKEVHSPGFVVDTKSDAFHIRTSPEMWKKKQGNNGSSNPRCRGFRR